MDASKFIAWRNTLGMTQEQMAANLGVSRMTVSRWEKGRAAIPGKYDATSTTAKATPRDITRHTHPELYIKQLSYFTWHPLHPCRLLGPRFHEDGSNWTWTDDVLSSPEYLTKRVEHLQKVKYDAAKDELTLVDREMIPDAIEGETMAQYKRRTGMLP